MSADTAPGLWRMLGRGLVRRCPWCGDRRAYFTGWFTKTDRCRACSMPWRRGDIGYELGPVVISTIITFGAIIVTVAVGMVATAPDFAVVELLIVIIGVAVVVPIVLYPIGYTLWQAIDLAMRPPSETGDDRTGRADGARYRGATGAEKGAGSRPDGP